MYVLTYLVEAFKPKWYLLVFFFLSWSWSGWIRNVGLWGGLSFLILGRGQNDPRMIGSGRMSETFCSSDDHFESIIH